MAGGKKKRGGLNIPTVLLTLVVITIIATSSIVTYQISNAVSSPTPAQTATQPGNADQAQLTYSNAKYGISYTHPSSWSPSGDVTNDPKTSATRQEFGTGLKLNVDTKNSNTIDIEILDEPLQSAETWYDQYYAQTPIKVDKIISTLKGKQSILYDFVAPTYETKQYLFAVGTKTYLFSSVNESVNLAASADYWSNFDTVFASLTISK